MTLIMRAYIVDYNMRGNDDSVLSFWTTTDPATVNKLRVKSSGVRSVGPANCSFRFRDGNESMACMCACSQRCSRARAIHEAHR